MRQVCIMPSHFAHENFHKRIAVTRFSSVHFLSLSEVSVPAPMFTFLHAELCLIRHVVDDLVLMDKASQEETVPLSVDCCFPDWTHPPLQMSRAPLNHTSALGGKLCNR